MRIIYYILNTHIFTKSILQIDAHYIFNIYLFNKSLIQLDANFIFNTHIFYQISPPNRCTLAGILKK